MTARRLTRRTAAVLLGLGAPAFAAARVSPAAEDTEAQLRAVRNAFARPDSAARLGAAYLARFPAERDPARLLAALGAAGAAPRNFGFRRRHAFLAALDQAARRDFRQGDVVQLEGWVLSVTELRASALVALAEGAA